MRPRRPRPALPDEIRIVREDNVSVIKYAAANEATSGNRAGSCVAAISTTMRSAVRSFTLNDAELDMVEFSRMLRVFAVIAYTSPS